MKNLALELQKYDYLFTWNHFFWNPELKYLYFNKNKDYELFFQFFIHILKYWTIDEILFYFKMDNIFWMQKIRDLKLDINNIEIKNKIDTIFKWLDILDYKPKIINDKTPLMREIERKKKEYIENQKILKPIEDLIDDFNKRKQIDRLKKNNKIPKDILLPLIEKMKKELKEKRDIN